ncbi:protein yellow [Hetaerina americana]|uniref:protein yellow n=1 Tax=Hetaerina americana TaxID=62018 RepID=UPI003A7F2E8B
MQPRDALLVAVFLLAVSTHASSSICDDVTLKWTGGYFEWPCKSTENIFTSTGRYIPKNIIATRIQVYKDEAIIAMPRFRSGTPVTLGRVNLRSRVCEPVIRPYPCWSLQEEGNCNALQNVVDIYIDINDILWVLDIGVVNTLEDQPIRRCPPKVVGFCVKTGKVVKIIDLSNLVCPTSRLQYIVADVAQDGFTYLYISDAATRSVIVYDVQRSRGLRVMLPKAVTAGCGGRRDVLYLALIRKPCGGSVLHLSYLSSSTCFSIRTEYLRRGAPNGRLIALGRKPAKLIYLGTDGGSNIFFRFEGQTEIYSWDSNKCFKQENFKLVWKDDGCLLATHAVPDYKKGRMRLLGSNFHDYLQGTVGCGAVQSISIIQGCF